MEEVLRCVLAACILDMSGTAANFLVDATPLSVPTLVHRGARSRARWKELLMSRGLWLGCLRRPLRLSRLGCRRRLRVLGRLSGLGLLGGLG